MPPSLVPLRQRLSTFAVWGAVVGVAFFGIYPTTNWWAGQRAQHYALYLPQELAVPFWPRWIWLYLSMYVLFGLPPFGLNPPALRRLARELIVATVLAGLVFVLWPAKLGFARVLPDDAFYARLFAGLFALDRPHNLVPSLHVTYSAAIALALMRAVPLGGRVALSVWLLAICASTVLVRQHHMLDVATGLVLSFLLHFWRRP